VNCADQPRTGTTTDGGYAEYAFARASGLVRIPDELRFNPIETAPLLCAGLTVYSALLQINARRGALVAVQGIGGLGHLGLQYAARLGYRVAAIARGAGKFDLASKLGADHYIDSSVENPGTALRQLGGAAAVIATASSGSSMSSLISGLAPRGQMIVVGAARDPISVQTIDLVFGTRSLIGSLTDSAIENEDNLALSVSEGIHPMTEVMPLVAAPEAYARMMSGKARFRIVLDTTA